MCCSWLRCRRRVADSVESDAPVTQAFEKQLPIEDATQEEEIQELKPRKKSADLHRVGLSAYCTARLRISFGCNVGFFLLFILLRYYVYDCVIHATVLDK